MLETTDLTTLKETAILFLHLEPKPIQEVEFLVDHPFFETVYAYDQSTGKMFNILSDQEAYIRYKKEFESLIQSKQNVFSIFILIRDSYKLTFFKYVCNYLSAKDFAESLKLTWTSSEFPSMDVNISKKKIANWFKMAEKDILMSEEEYKTYKSLDEMITVYRGVCSDKYKAGLSWTFSRNKAEWFATRFSYAKCLPVIYSFKINKSDILAYINNRNEHEVIIDPNTLKKYTINLEYL